MIESRDPFDSSEYQRKSCTALGLFRKTWDQRWVPRAKLSYKDQEEIQHKITGVSTNIGPETTVRDAVVRDYKVILLGLYFFASYIGHREYLQIQEKSLTVHDDLLAIDGRHNGNKIVVGKFGLILLTKDGGKTWQRQPLTREEMKNCIWLKPQLVTQIEFVEWTADGHLRHSKFIGLREDKDPLDVMRETDS